MKPIPPSDFCRWAYPDVIQKSERHRYLVFVKGRQKTRIMRWTYRGSVNGRFFCPSDSGYYGYSEIELAMILPNDPSENDTKEP